MKKQLIRRWYDPQNILKDMKDLKNLKQIIWEVVEMKWN